MRVARFSSEGSRRTSQQPTPRRAPFSYRSTIQTDLAPRQPPSCPRQHPGCRLKSPAPPLEQLPGKRVHRFHPPGHPPEHLLEQQEPAASQRPDSVQFRWSLPVTQPEGCSSWGAQALLQAAVKTTAGAAMESPSG